MVTHAGTHVTVYASLQMLGLGREGRRVRRIASDGQGRMRPDALREALATIDGPTIVCAQAGNVNTGAFDPFAELIPIAHERGAWVHVDGAFGIWAAAVPSMRHLMLGHDAADSWSTDAHKWLNVPYDSGLVVRPRRRRRTMARWPSAPSTTSRPPAPSGIRTTGRPNRRGARAASRCWPRSGRSAGRAWSDLIERDCALARRMAERLRPARGSRSSTTSSSTRCWSGSRVPPATPTARRVTPGRGRSSRRSSATGPAGWAAPTWAGRAAMRVSVSGWQTTADDIDRSADVDPAVPGVGRRLTAVSRSGATVTTTTRTRPTADADADDAAAPLVIVNPRAARLADPRRRREVTEAIARAVLARTGRPARVVDRDLAASRAALARLATMPEPPLVVVAGGDGTIRDAASVLAGRRIPMAIIPGGTGNVLASALGLGSVRAAVDAIRHGRERTIDLGSARWGPMTPDAARPSREGMFVAACGMGLDARIMAAAQHEWKRRMRFGAYVGAAIGELTRLTTAVFRIVADGKELEIRGYLVLLANTGDIIPGRVGPRRPLDPADGRLELIVLGADHPFDGLRAAAALLLSRDELDGRVIRRSVTEVRVEADPVQPIQVDGDDEPPGWLEARVLPGALTVLAPAR